MMFKMTDFSKKTKKSSKPTIKKSRKMASPKVSPYLAKKYKEQIDKAYDILLKPKSSQTSMDSRIKKIMKTIDAPGFREELDDKLLKVLSGNLLSGRKSTLGRDFVILEVLRKYRQKYD